MHNILEIGWTILITIYFLCGAFLFYQEIKEHKEKYKNKQRLEILQDTIKYAKESNNQDLINACKQEIEKQT